LSSLSRGIEDYTHAIGQLLERDIDSRTVYASESVLEATPAELGALADVVFDFPAHSPSELLSIVAQEEENLRLAATLIADGKLVACRRGETTNQWKKKNDHVLCHYPVWKYLYHRCCLSHAVVDVIPGCCI
jgi:hypothetical protein